MRRLPAEVEARPSSAARPSTLRGRAGAYLALARVAYHTVMTYRANHLISLVGVLLQIYLLRVVWTAVYADRGSVDGVALGTMITFATLATLQHALLRPPEVSLIPERVRMGMIAIDLSRPVGFLTQVLAGQFGATAARALLLVVAFPFAVLAGGVQAPASPTAAAAFAASLVLAYLVGQVLSVILGLVAFWTVEAEGTLMVYRFVEQFLSGALVPLWFMPDALRAVAAALPFQAMVYAPLAAYLGQATGAELLRSLVVQAAWLVVLWPLAWALWSRALRRVVVHGG